MKRFPYLFTYSLTVLFLLTAMTSQAQKNHANATKDSVIQIENVSPKNDTAQEVKALKSAISADTIIPFVANKLEKFSMKIHMSNRTLKNLIDLTAVNNDFDTLNIVLDRFQKRMTSANYKMNLQSSNTSTILLGEKQREAEEKLDALTKLYKDLTTNNKDIKGILRDPVFQLSGIPDSNLVAQLHELKKESKTLDSSESIDIAKVNYTRSKLATLDLRLKDFLSDLHYVQQNRMASIWKKEEPALWLLKKDTAIQKQSLSANINSALATTFRILPIYLMGKSGIIALGVFFLFATWWIMYSSKKNLKRNTTSVNNTLRLLKLLSHNVWICALYGALCCFPFFFANPPMSFLELLEVMQLILLSILLRPFLNRKEYIVWIVFTVLCILLCLDNQLLESTIGERWWLCLLLTVLIGTLVYSFVYIKKLDNLFSQNKRTKTLFFIALFLAILAFLSNITGRVTSAKILGFTAIQIIVLAKIYSVFAQMTLEFMYLYSEANSNSRLSAFINYGELRNKYSRRLYIVGTIAFVIGITHSLYLYSPLSFLINRLLMQHHTIGAFDFTLYSIFIFILVIWISGLISSFVRFVLGNETFGAQGKRNKIGSMTLLVRLAIWILGFLVAIAAAGIPIDKVTIILSALGVGIGFGLQNIANNLVSGVILAFERPIQVGDSIDIDGTSGTVSEIGVRSSKLKVSGGSDVIIPNGDLLSHKITNWTLTSRSKQDVFPVRVQYGEDLYKVKAIIENEIAHSEHILQSPPISVSVSDFGSNTVLLKVYFWVRDVDNSSSIRSELMYQVYARLLKENIQLPKDNGNGEYS